MVKQPFRICSFEKRRNACDFSQKKESFERNQSCKETALLLPTEAARKNMIIIVSGAAHERRGSVPSKIRTSHFTHIMPSIGVCAPTCMNRQVNSIQLSTNRSRLRLI